MEMQLHKKKNLHCKDCEAHLPTFHIEIPFTENDFFPRNLVLTLTVMQYFPSLWNVWEIVLLHHLSTDLEPSPNFQSVETPVIRL